MHRRRLLIMLGACLVTFAAGAQACSDHPRSAATVLAPMSAKAAALVAWKPRAWRPDAAPAVSAGLRAALDPETGTWGLPTPEQAEALSRVGDADEQPVSVIRRANGSYSAKLDERWASHAVITLDADGKPSWTCVRGSKAAEQFVRNPKAPARPTGPAPGVVWEEK